MSDKEERYKTIQVNLSWEKHKDLINWLIKKADDEETSLNSVILRALKKEYAEDVKKEHN